jgi:predicted polyphosphate/ATP-dependent NAD kinase
VTSQPASVGIIANPASGTDIRRLVALGTVFGTQDKINIVQRILVGLDAAAIERFYLMPDAFQIGRMALDRLPADKAHLGSKAEFVDMPTENRSTDSVRAARQMRELGVNCIVVLGGDGTSRAVAKGCGQVPILPVSTGTNNVVPRFVEGTTAGLAAGFVARQITELCEVAERSKRLAVLFEDGHSDMALVDVAVVEGLAPGSRAVWQPEKLQHVVLTRAEPCATGMSSLGGFLAPVSAKEPRGLYLRLGAAKICRVTAPLAPGLMASFGVEEIRTLAFGDEVVVPGGRRLLALDGEREITLQPDDMVRIRLCDDGPWIVDVHLALRAAATQGLFVDWSCDSEKGMVDGIA